MGDNLVLTPERLAEIEALAKKATPGPYTARQALSPVDGAYDWAIAAQIDGRPQVILEAFGRSDWTVYIPAEHNASLHAALDPQTVLALLASHAALSAEVERLRLELADLRFQNSDLVRDKGRILCDVGRRDYEIETLRKQLTADRESAAREMREAVIALIRTSCWSKLVRDNLVADISALPLTPADGAMLEAVR